MSERTLRPRTEHASSLATSDRAAQTFVSEIAVRDALLVDADDRLSDAVDELSGIGSAVAVAVDGCGRPIGVVTLADVARALADGEVARDRTGPALRARFDEAFGEGFHLEVPDALRVRDVCRPALALAPDTTVAQAAALLAAAGLAHAIVTDPYVVHGVISWEETLHWLAEQSSFVLPGRTALRPSEPTARKVRPKGMVIVVEDDVDVASTMAEVLHDEGYGVITTPNGREALEVLRALPNPPGLILLDLMMPEMNGWEFRDAQIRDQALASIPVVIMTAFAERFDRDELHGPSALLRKPLSTDALIDIVERHYRALN